MNSTIQNILKIPFAFALFAFILNCSTTKNKVDNTSEIFWEGNIKYHHISENKYDTLDLKMIEISLLEYTNFESLYALNCELEDGFIKGYNLYFEGDCNEICTNYLVDKKTNNKLSLPSSFDQGIIGIYFSPSCRYFLTFSSYDMAVKYGNRAEITGYKIIKGKGINAIEPLFYRLSFNYSIDNITWIDDTTIAIKAYQENNSDMDFKYFKAVVNN